MTSPSSLNGGESLIEDMAIEAADQANSNAQSSPGSFLVVGVGMFEGNQAPQHISSGCSLIAKRAT
jgi:hypothetical protein